MSPRRESDQHTRCRAIACRIERPQATSQDSLVTAEAERALPGLVVPETTLTIWHLELRSMVGLIRDLMARAAHKERHLEPLIIPHPPPTHS